jgi:hypothetical protein
MNYTYFIKNINKYADILAIPLFALLVYYFYNIQNKTIIEYILFSFAVTGLIFDSVFTYIFFRHQVVL